METLLSKRAPQSNNNGGPTFAILGVGAVGDGSVYPRREIRELETDPDQWNVFLLGLRRFQRMDQSDMLSYYQIAGIHGRPFKPWDGVQQAEGGHGGYCAHGSNIFATWHRPYLALFEQVLYLNAREAIREFPPSERRDRYENALATLRLPYWDWATASSSGEGVYPSSLQSPNIDITLPNGTLTVKNPLYSYTFHPLNHEDLYDPNLTQYSIYPSTVRSPSSKEPTAASRNDLISTDLEANRANLQSRVYNMFTMMHDYYTFSNDISSKDSLEGIHDTVHGLVGKGGHMSQVPYAGFDPIFWLHHANVDRLFAIWQSLNPESYVWPNQSRTATFAVANGTVLDADSALQPFHADDRGKTWTSNSVRSTSTFSYTYPELADSPTNSDLVARINALYGPDATAPTPNIPVSTPRTSFPGHGHQPIAGAPSFSSRRQYICDIKVRKFALDGSFFIYVFLGEDPGDDASAWTGLSSFVGVHGVFAASGMHSDVEVHGAVPLTAALEARLNGGGLEGMGEGGVESYLKESLRWRVKSMDGRSIPLDQVPSLQVSVSWSEVEPARSRKEFPKMKGDWGLLHGATDGRKGGWWGKGNSVG
ncbi:Di-copper centre-containing protein [Delitschia confertaspora ATCC 74209]|uniref:tyrosinase n=1 Tax=Delitschia confertaspora ATCC 74209 TaxID=1513339 RepID=A0A9P4JHW3_9PLEO|nr:Di-copper centre-containing protein [Delitschia confertaspora ATCC 74209]